MRGGATAASKLELGNEVILTRTLIMETVVGGPPRWKYPGSDRQNNSDEKIFDQYLPRDLCGVVLPSNQHCVDDLVWVGFLPMVFPEEDFNNIFVKTAVTPASDNSEVGDIVSIQRHRTLTRNENSKIPKEPSDTFNGHITTGHTSLTFGYGDQEQRTSASTGHAEDLGTIYNKWVIPRRIRSDLKYWGVCMDKYKKLVPIKYLNNNTSAVQEKNEGQTYSYTVDDPADLRGKMEKEVSWPTELPAIHAEKSPERSS